METLFLVLSVSSIGVMLYALYKAFVLRHRVPGGKVRSTFAFCLPNSKMCSSE